MAEKTTKRGAGKPKAAPQATETPDLAALTAEQAAEMIRQLQEQLAAATAPAPAPAPEIASEAQVEQVRQLQAALLDSRRKEQAAKRLAKQANDEEVFEVTSLIGAAVSVEVTGSNGKLKRVMFEQQGAVQFLTAGQIAEVADQTDFFDLGYLSAPDAVPGNPNTIQDYDAFLAALDPNEVRAKIDQMDSTEVLFSLYHHIEGKRFEVEGNELIQVPISGTEQMALYAIMERIRILTGVNLSANDAE